MRITAVRRAALAACAVSLSLLVTACGGAEAGGEGADKAGEKAAAEPAAEAMTSAELDKLVLAEGDVEDHKVSEAGAADLVDAKSVTVDKAACEPFAHALAGVPLGEPGATVHRKVVSEHQKGGERPSMEELAQMPEKEAEEAMASALNLTMTMTSLSSYGGGAAEKAVADLRTAATDCAGGFTMTVGADEQKVTGLGDEKVTGGEEALAWTVTAEQEGEPVPLKLVVVRQGTTLASFAAANLTGMGTGQDYPLPTAVIDAQVSKLG